MALSNSQYDQLMRDYEQLQLDNEHELRLRFDEVYAKIPKLRTIDDTISSLSVEKAKRLPFGVWQRKLENHLDVLPVMWTVDPLDWTTENIDEVVNKVVSQAKENDIILLHDCYKSSVEAALRIVDLLKAEGFEFVTVDKLILE